jgi:hypothetical protein
VLRTQDPSDLRVRQLVDFFAHFVRSELKIRAGLWLSIFVATKMSDAFCQGKMHICCLVELFAPSALLQSLRTQETVVLSGTTILECSALKIFVMRAGL